MSRKIMQFREEMQRDKSRLNAEGKVIITNYKNKEIALLIKDNRMHSLFTIENDSKVGNIYVGKVKNVIKNLDACFVEIADKEIAYLPFGEVKSPMLLNRQFDGRLIQGDELLVQVNKDAIKTKQASLTCKISVSSNYFVFTYEETSIGVSAKLSKELREQIKVCIQEIESQADRDMEDLAISCIVRTDAGKLFSENSLEFITQYQKEKKYFLELLRKSLHATCFSCIKGGLKPYLAILERFSNS